MAKKALVEKWAKEPKFPSRRYNRCKICGRPHGYLTNFRYVPYNAFEVMIMTGALYYMSKDQESKDYKENIGNITLNVVEGANSRLATAQKIDTFARAVCALTTNTFQDSFVEYSYSINEVIIEEQED